MEMIFATFPSWSLLVIRLAMGVVFFAHGAQKVFGCFGGNGMRATVDAFRQYMGIPAGATVLASLIECFGGLALIVGLLRRPAALGLIAVMLVAIAKVHWRNGFFINFQNVPNRGHGYEFNYALAAMALAILLGGAGMCSIDRLIFPLGE